MAMTGGSVTVNPHDGTWSGTGLAKALMDAYQPKVIGGYESPNVTTIVNVSNFCAQLANAFGPALVAYLQANAKAHITTESLGAMPASTSAGTPIAHPASPVDVPIT